MLKLPFTVFYKNKTTLNTLPALWRVKYITYSNLISLFLGGKFQYTKYAAHWAITQNINLSCHLPPAVFPSVQLPEAANTLPFWKKKTVCLALRGKVFKIELTIICLNGSLGQIKSQLSRVTENTSYPERLKDQFQSGEDSEEYDFVFDGLYWNDIREKEDRIKYIMSH